ncbi:MAG: pilus assembly protein [Alphaproteobacteria bacterium]|jgi:Flp pilus assembly protein TadG|nr:pilus assembly protein [Alphaproteobacteria bacterium]MBT4086796.1 pilus assembly protein [Alphaproteobacteria bacterium]MBT4542453.1 pilus assembly protein [Alphaproteobacteria bacterium]MBT7745983.1 pilus assembly protein [Alphaproteobacteria bacterium]
MKKQLSRTLLGFKLKMSQFGRDVRGVVAIEFGVIMPLVIILLFAILQYGMIFNTRQIMTHAARVAVRSYAIGESTADEAETMATELLNNEALSYTIDVTDDGTDATIDIVLPMSEAAIVDALGGSLMDGNIEVTIKMRMED